MAAYHTSIGLQGHGTANTNRSKDESHSELSQEMEVLEL